MCIMLIKRVAVLIRVCLLVLVAMIFGGCSSNNTSVSSAPSPRPVPTIALIFAAQRPTALPLLATSASIDSSFPSPTSLTTSRPASADAIPGRRIAIYDDVLNSNWSLEHTTGARYNLAGTAYVDRGSKALVVTPSGGEGTVLFTVKQTSREVYKRDRVLGISFRLSGGPNDVSNDALIISLQGSNAYPYWVAHDSSVKVKGRVTDKAPIFSETRLYYLNINQPVPPNTWVDVVIWLDDLIYDPDYTYVTGFQIKNDKAFQNTYYIDQANLIVVR